MVYQRLEGAAEWNSPPEQAWAQLWAAVDAGDDNGKRHAWNVLQAHIQPAVEAALRFKTPHVQDREEAVQETFLNAYKFLGTYQREKGLEGFVPWVNQIARNARLTQLRKRHGVHGNRPAEVSFSVDETEGRSDQNPALADSATPEAAMLEREQHEPLRRALLALSERDRTAVILRDLVGLPGERVAQVLGVSEATVSRMVAASRDVMHAVMTHPERKDQVESGPSHDELIERAKVEALAKLHDADMAAK